MNTNVRSNVRHRVTYRSVNVFILPYPYEYEIKYI